MMCNMTLSRGEYWSHLYFPKPCLKWLSDGAEELANFFSFGQLQGFVNVTCATHMYVYDVPIPVFSTPSLWIHFSPSHPSLPPSHPSIFLWLSDHLNFVSTQEYWSGGRGVKLFSRQVWFVSHDFYFIANRRLLGLPGRFRRLAGHCLQLVIKADFGAFWPLPSSSFWGWEGRLCREWRGEGRVRD